MAPEQTNTLHEARPFRPFTIHLADGSSVEVPHPELKPRTQGGRTVIVNTSGEHGAIIDLLLVTKLTLTNGTARQRRRCCVDDLDGNNSRSAVQREILRTECCWATAPWSIGRDRLRVGVHRQRLWGKSTPTHCVACRVPDSDSRRHVVRRAPGRRYQSGGHTLFGRAWITRERFAVGGVASARRRLRWRGGGASP
jgi:hypothetical protein